MSNKKWLADRLHTGRDWAEPGTVVVTNGQGKILDLVPEEAAGDDIERVAGVIAPGFVNAHCHLELSHLKGHIPQHTGMIDFLLQVMQLQRFRPEEKERAMMEAIAEMRGNGVVAVGDISKGTDSIGPKLSSDIYFHNFVEITGFVPELAQVRWQAGTGVVNAFLECFPPGQVILTPHAPYSVSPELFELLLANANGRIMSIHQMESEDEISFFREKQGDFNRLYAHLGVHIDFFKPTGTNPLRYLWPLFKNHYPWLWVHNTEISLHDLEWLDEQGIDWSAMHFCLCPAANQYINFATPALHRFRDRFPLQLCLGTDSLASNHYLNPVYEMRLMQKHGRLYDLGYLLQMATFNGARALGITQRFGSFETGKTPGIVLLKGLEGDLIVPKTKAERLE